MSRSKKDKKKDKKKRRKDKTKETSLFKEPMATKDVIADYDKPLTTSSLLAAQMLANHRAQTYAKQGICFLDRLQALRVGATKLKVLQTILKRMLKEQT